MKDLFALLDELSSFTKQNPGVASVTMYAHKTPPQRVLIQVRSDAEVLAFAGHRDVTLERMVSETHHWLHATAVDSTDPADADGFEVDVLGPPHLLNKHQLEVA